LPLFCELFMEKQIEHLLSLLFPLLSLLLLLFLRFRVLHKHCRGVGILERAGAHLTLFGHEDGALDNT
jgi:hypothetical protein